jgi:IS30 family transposase
MPRIYIHLTTQERAVVMTTAVSGPLLNALAVLPVRSTANNGVHTVLALTMPIWRTCRVVPDVWRARLPKLHTDGPLFQVVRHYLHLHWSPQQIANILRLMWPDDVVDSFSAVLNRHPAEMRKSMTYEQGREMHGHKILTERTGVQIYFADPHSPWQRGSNENTNGLLLRQYMPKGSDLSISSQEELDAIALELNTRPRQTLGWKTPLPVGLVWRDVHDNLPGARSR